MNDFALQLLLVAGSNAVVATLLGIAAAWLLRRGHAAVAHSLCALALVKLLTPPLVPLPLLAAEAPPATVPLSDASLALLLEEGLLLPASAPFPWALAAVVAAGLGALALLGRALRQAGRFRRLLRLAAPAPAALAARSRALAAHMRVTCPELLVVPARISPMLCVLEGQARIVLPQALVTSVPPSQCDALLAHELAHAARRDHWVRALELAATCLYWWLPTVWWLRRTLRTAEERCCDRRVLEVLPGHGRAYADALLSTLDFLTGEARAMPPVACGAGAFSDLKTRLTTIMSESQKKPMSWFVRAALLGGAAAMLPVAPTVAQQGSPSEEAVEKAHAELKKAMAEIAALRAELGALRAHVVTVQQRSADEFEHGRQAAERFQRLRQDPATAEQIERLLELAPDAAARGSLDEVKRLLELHAARGGDHGGMAVRALHEHLERLLAHGVNGEDLKHLHELLAARHAQGGAEDGDPALPALLEHLMLATRAHGTTREDVKKLHAAIQKAHSAEQRRDREQRQAGEARAREEAQLHERARHWRALAEERQTDTRTTAEESGKAAEAPRELRESRRGSAAKGTADEDELKQLREQVHRLMQQVERLQQRDRGEQLR